MVTKPILSNYCSKRTVVVIFASHWFAVVRLNFHPLGPTGSPAHLELLFSPVALASH